MMTPGELLLGSADCVVAADCILPQGSSKIKSLPFFLNFDLEKVKYVIMDFTKIIIQ